MYQANALKDIIPTIEISAEGPVSGGPFTFGMKNYQSVEWDVPVLSVTGEMARDVTTELYTDFLLKSKQNAELFLDIAKVGNDKNELGILNRAGAPLSQTIIFNAQSVTNDTNGLKPLHGSVTVEDFGVAFKQAAALFDRETRLVDKYGVSFEAIRDQITTVRILREIAKSSLHWPKTSPTGTPATVSAKYNNYTSFKETDPGIRHAWYRIDLSDDKKTAHIIHYSEDDASYKSMVLCDYAFIDSAQVKWSEFRGPNQWTTIPESLAYLRSRGIPPFEIPSQYGGGKKYIVILPDGGVETFTRLPLPDALYIHVPLSLFLEALFPRTLVTGDSAYLPVFPKTAVPACIIMGYPGVFRFVPKGKKAQQEIKKDLKDYNRMEGIAWEETAVYRSARSPNGCVMYRTAEEAKVDEFIQTQAAHSNSQDTVLMYGPAYLNSTGKE